MVIEVGKFYVERPFGPHREYAERVVGPMISVPNAYGSMWVAQGRNSTCCGFNTDGTSPGLSNTLIRECREPISA